MKLDSYKAKELRYVLHLMKSSPLTLAGFLIVICLAIFALIAPYVVPYPESIIGKANLEERLQPPSINHIFGTDEMGRDIFSRVFYGCRLSLQIGVIVVVIAATIGVVLGAFAGYFGGIIDFIIMRITDVFLSLPSLILALAIAAVLGSSLFNAMIAIALAWWPWYTRLVRAQTLSIREATFVEAARATGLGNLKIIYRHVLPHCIAPIIVQATLDMGYVILTAASLGFLGLGAQPPMPEWGLMVSIGKQYFSTWWWNATFPGLAIFISVLGFNLLGDGLRDMLDPKLRRSMQ
ncbi:MAG: ABC transporter permease [Candidatus Jordarchaeaceae archaeon]